MKHERNMKRNLLGSLFAVTLTLTMLLGFAVTAAAADGSGKTVLAFSSDVHNGYDNTSSSSTRFDTWLNAVKQEYGVGAIDVVGFCGDMGPASGYGDSYWNNVKNFMQHVDDHEAIKSSNEKAVYATGNHEYMNGQYDDFASNAQRQKIKYGAEARNDSNYRIYLLGTASGATWNQYSQDQITKLTQYLNSVDNSKPIFVLTHFPLHQYSSRVTSNAKSVIQALNNAVDNNKQTIVLLWGHNHTEGDTHYDQVYKPGAGLKYGSGSDIAGIKFIYAAAGSLADQGYGQSQKVLGKGLIVTIDPNNNNALDFAYYDKAGNKLNKTYNEIGDGKASDDQGSGSDPVVPVQGDVNIEPTTSNPEVSKNITAGDTFTINVTNGSSSSAYDYTLSLSNTGVAEIVGNATQNIAAGATKQFTVKGLTNGTVDINIKNSQSSSQYVRKGVVHVTVGEGGSTPVDPDPQPGDSVDVTPTTDNPEKTIRINVGDTFTINTTNGSSNNAYDFTATSGNSSIAQIQGSATKNIGMGDTAQFTVKGIASGKTDINIQNSNQYGSQYTRKATIHVIVGEGGSTPDPVDPEPQPVDKVDVTPIYDTPYPEKSAQISVGDTFTINVTNGTEHDATYTFTATLSENGIAELTKASTGEVAPGAVGTLTVKGIKEGTVDINIQNDNDMEGYTRKAIIHLTVVPAPVSKYTVNFVDDDDSVISTAEYEKGTKAEDIVVPENPAKEETAEFAYEFKEWTPAIADVTADATYKATYTATKKKYTVTFVDDQNHPIKEAKEYEYGTKAEDIDVPENPVKEATAEYTYTFKAWDPAIVDVTTSATYKATFDAKVNTYKVIWKNGDDSILESEPNVPYGNKVSYTGKATPTKAEDDKYTYTFEGWVPEIPEGGYVVTGETTFVPKFKAVAKSEVKPDDGSKGTGQDDKNKGGNANVTADPDKAPTAEEAANAPLNNSLPVINPEKIKTTGSMSKQTMTIKLGNLNIDNCLVEYKTAGAKTWKSVWYGKGSQLVIKNMKKNGFYQYRFTAFKVVNGKWNKGKVSNTCYRWIKNIKAKKPVAGKKRFTFKWKKVKSANGYEIQYATNKAFTKSAKKVTVKGAKKTSKTIKGLKKGKAYYVRIRPYKTKGGKKYLGIYTVAKKVKVK